MRSPVAALRPTFRWLLKGYLLVGLVLIATVIGLFTLHLTRQVDQQAQLTTRLIGRLLGDAIFSNAPEEVKRQQLAQLRAAIDDVAFPFVVTAEGGQPWFWNPGQIGIPLGEDEDLGALLAADVANPQDERLRELLSAVERFDRQRDPIPVTAPGSDQVVSRLHYGPSAVSRQLLWMPILEAALIVAFMGVALLAFRNMKRSEQRSLWVGMAKETAHQMGTPLTSLNGWLALLSDPDAGGALSPEEVVTEVRRDVDRLGKVSARFSQIGSRPKLGLGRVDELVRQVCAYFQTRLPHLGKQVDLVQRVEEVPLAPISTELLDWALENLVKNALDAIDKENGVVEVACRLRPDGEWIELTVTDNGKGMSPDVQRRVFDPGFSTKQRGWGMGLVLVHRIIVEYHQGHIGVAHSVPGVGTTMRVLLKTH